RTVEGADEAARIRRETSAPEPLELLARVCVETIDPAGGIRAASRVRRGEDARAHHRREHAIELEATARADQELLDLVEHRVLIADKRQMVVTRQLHQLRVR